LFPDSFVSSTSCRDPDRCGDEGRDARDVMLGLAKTCMKLKLSFYDFIGDRLGIPGPKIPDLANLLRPAPT
jgi:hypothetical protein